MDALRQAQIKLSLNYASSHKLKNVQYMSLGLTEVTTITAVSTLINKGISSVIYRKSQWSSDPKEVSLYHKI